MKNLELAIVAILLLFLLLALNSDVSENFDKSSVFPSHDKTLIVNGTVK